MSDQYLKEIIDPGDRASKLGKEVGYASHGNNAAVKIVPRQPGNFRGPVSFIWQKEVLEGMLKEEVAEEVENDGAGGKPQFFTLLADQTAFRGLGWEIITMTADDFARTGRLPVIIANDLNVKRITEGNWECVKNLFEGYGDALKESSLINITGETAIMKHSVTAFCDESSDDQLIVNWGATCIGVSHKQLLLDPKNIKPGMTVVALSEDGYRCNGGTFFTNLLLKKFGPSIKSIRSSPEAMKLVKMLTIPSVSYARFICDYIGWGERGDILGLNLNIVAIAHITGGGVWGKFGEILPEGVGAVLPAMPEPPDVLRLGQDYSQEIPELALSDYQCYSTFHGGPGMLVVCADEAGAKNFIANALEHGFKARVAGFTVDQDKNDGEKLIIHSKFSEGKILRSSEHDQ